MDLMDRKGISIPLAAMLAVQAIVSMVAVTVPVMAPVAANDIGISSTSVGIYVSLIYISSMISSLWSGDFILRYGALRVSQVCLIFCGIGLMLTAFASIPANDRQRTHHRPRIWPGNTGQFPYSCP